MLGFYNATSEKVWVLSLIHSEMFLSSNRDMCLIKTCVNIYSCTVCLLVGEGQRALIYYYRGLEWLRWPPIPNS